MNDSELITRAFFCMVVDGRLREISVFEHQAILFPKLMAAIDTKNIRSLAMLSISDTNGSDTNGKMHEVSFSDAIMIAESLGVNFDSLEDQKNFFNIPIPGDETLTFQFSDFNNNDNNNDNQVLEDFAQIIIEAYEVEAGGIIPVKTSDENFGVILVVNDIRYGAIAMHYRPNDENYNDIITKFCK